MVERPRFIIETKETNSVDYVDIVDIPLSADIKGLSFFTLSIDPDPNARYLISVGLLYYKVDLEITAIWKLELPHLDKGWYQGFRPTDHIKISHKTVDAAITVKSAVTLSFSEVVE